MKIVVARSRFWHESSFAQGEPLPLHYTLVTVLRALPERDPMHNPNAGPLCGCAGDCLQREVVKAFLHRAKMFIETSKRENGTPMRAYLNIVPDSNGEKELGQFLKEDRKSVV